MCCGQDGSDYTSLAALGREGQQQLRSLMPRGP